MKKILLCFPRSGSHLATKILRININHYVNIDTPIEKIEKKIKGGGIWTHKPYFKEFVETIKSWNIPVYILLRDPRDIIVSYAHWYDKSDKFVYGKDDILKKLSYKERVDFLISYLYEYLYLHDEYRKNNIGKPIYFHNLLQDRESEKYTEWKRRGIVGAYKDEMTEKQIQESTEKYEYLIKNWSYSNG